MLERTAWSALFVALLAAPASAQSPPPAPPADASPAPAAAPASAPAEAAPAGEPARTPAEAPPGSQPGSEAVPFVVQNPYPPAPVARGRLPPPRLYPVTPRPPPPPPRRYGHEGAPFSAGIGATFVYRDDVGYRRLGADSPQAELDLFASYDVFQAGARTVLAAGLGYRFGELGNAGGLLVTSHAVSAELLARFKANWLAPHLRAAVGLIASRLRLEDASAELRLEDRERGAFGVLGGGFTLRTPSRLFETHAGKLASLSLGVLIEGGYIIAPDASYHGEPKGGSEVPQETPALGSLDQAGGYLRLLAVLRF